MRCLEIKKIKRTGTSPQVFSLITRRNLDLLLRRKSENHDMDEDTPVHK